MKCEKCESGPVYEADLGGGNPAYGLANARLYLCADCHPHFDTDPPYEEPPAYCGRETATGEPCKNGRGLKPWQSCHLHGDAPWPDQEVFK